MASKVTAKVSPVESVFEVEIETDNLFESTFKFAVENDGTVNVMDNWFGDTNTAATALRQMADFLAKYKAK